MTMYTRRKILLDAVAYAALGIASGRNLSHANAQEQPENGAVIREWMDQVQGGRKVFGNEIVGRFAEPMYFLLRPVTWEPSKGEKLPRVTVPIGYVTDFSSVPRVYWTVVRPDPIFTFPAILHDYLYWAQITTRDNADEIFRISMQELAIAEETVSIILKSVRFFGENVWERNARLKYRGEKRVLRRFPDNPMVTWDDWKKRPDVF